MSKLREKTEARTGLLSKMQDLFDKVEARGDDFTSEELKEYTSWEEAVKSLDAEIAPLKQMEERKKSLALESAKKDNDVDTVIADATKLNANPDPDKVEVKNEIKASKEARDVNTFKLLKGIMTRNQHAVDNARKELAEGGHYDDMLKSKDGTTKSFDTLVDTNGGILVPTSITSEVMTIVQSYGVVPRLATNFGDINQETIKVPQILGVPSFTAVGEGQEITATGFGLGAIELKAHKWGAIIPWTNEVSDSVAGRLMPMIMNGTAEGFAKKQDDAFFNGDGTSAYNGIQGLEGLAGSVNYVRVASAAAGNNTYELLDADDFILPQQNIAPGARSGCVYVMHPNMIFILRKLKDGAGNYIYGAPSSLAPAGTLWGYPIETSEAFNYVTGSAKTVCAFFNPKYLAYATGRTLSAEELREGTITVNGADVKLGATDQKALRFTGAFDLFMSSVTRPTAGTEQGAFSILRTV